LGRRVGRLRIAPPRIPKWRFPVPPPPPRVRAAFEVCLVDPPKIECPRICAIACALLPHGAHGRIGKRDHSSDHADNRDGHPSPDTNNQDGG
jgi:hypothetical protein